MALRDIVSVSITRRNTTVAQAGFSTPLVLSYHSRFVDRMRSVATLAELEALGFTSDDQAHKDVSAILSQPLPPSTIKIGRRANAFTQTIVLTPDVADEQEYAIELDGLEASYTSDATATGGEIATGLAAAVNALADVDAIVTATASSASPVTLSGADLDGALGYRALTPSRRITLTLDSDTDWDATTAVITGKDALGNTLTENLSIPNDGNTTLTTVARFARVTSVTIPAQTGTGGSFTVGVAAPMVATVTDTTNVTLTAPAGIVVKVEMTVGEYSLDDTTADPGLAADFAACVSEDPDFYGILLDSNGPAEVLALAAVVEAHANRYLFMATASQSACGDPDSITDVMYRLQDLQRYRTAPIYHPVVGVSAAAAWMGNGIAYTPGTITWALREVVGLPSYTLPSEARTAILAKNGTLIEVNAGRTHTVGGKVSGGEWVDIIHGLDRLHARIGERIFGAMLAASQDGRLPFTDAGIHKVDTELRAQLKEDEDSTFLDAGWTTSVPTAASLTASQRRSRVLSGVTFNASPQGAIHAVAVTGTVA